MKSFWKKLIIGVVAAGAVAGLVVAYIVGHQDVVKDAANDQPIKAPTRVEVVNGENVITLDQSARAGSGVVLSPLQSVSHRTEISAYGTVVELGEITDLRNTLANANAQLAKANAALAVARPDFERVKGLFDANQNVSQKSVQAAEGAWHAEESNVQAAQAAVEAAQATAQERWGSVVAGWVSRGGADP